MPQSSSDVFVKAKRPALSFRDYRRICRVKFTHVLASKFAWVTLCAKDYENERLPSELEGCELGHLVLQGEWFRQITGDDGKKSFQDGDLFNVAWSLRTDQIIWVAPRDPGPSSGQNNQGFW